jgi:DNA-binding CsgD family transcriptional regulator
VLTARMHSNLGEVEKAGQVATTALDAASQAGDSWAMGWALHVLTIVTAVQGRADEALPLVDRALAVTEADPAMTDLRILLQLNQAVMLNGLEHHEEALAAARQAQQLANQAGTVIRLGQAHCALAQMFFETGRWDDALAEAAALPEDLKEPGVACCDLGIAAVICFHRGEISAARDHLAATGPHAEWVGNRVIPPLALARSLELEHAHALPEALAQLTAGFASNAEEVEPIEDLLLDAVRLATDTGDLDTAWELAGRAGKLAADSELPHRKANALFCQGLVDRDADQLLQAADRYAAATRPLFRAQALEAAAAAFVRSGDRDQARAAFTRALELYDALGAAADVARLAAQFRAHGIRRGPQSKHRRVQSGWDSLTPTETKIAALVEGGLSNPDIAAQLFLSRRTVATHVSHILKKLNVQTRTDVAREAALRTIVPK